MLRNDVIILCTKLFTTSPDANGMILLHPLPPPGFAITLFKALSIQNYTSSVG